MIKEILQKYPRICGHIIAESLGYATPERAADILLSYIKREKNYCEWVYCCYSGNPEPVVKGAIRNRHHHRGYMASYSAAKKIIKATLEGRMKLLLASWM
jgi:hypothetical protein